LASQSFKLTVVSEQVDFGLVAHGAQKMMAVRQFLREFRRRVYRRVHVAAKCFLGRRQRGNHVAESDLAHDQNIDVAAALLGAARPGTVKEPNVDMVTQWMQSRAQYVGHARGFHDEALQFRKDRRAAIGPIEDLSSLCLPFQDARLGQLFQFPLHCPQTGLSCPRQLTQVVPFVRIPKQGVQYRLAGLAKKS
jgi:hypothetical protein